ncbi:MAG: alanine racemase [Candidatus Thorarchaeota archaeon]
MRINDLITPAVVVDYSILTSNIDDMTSRMKGFNVDLRPHIKTHKCIPIGQMQMEAGAMGITVSTMGEAIVFADAGFDDITIAFPVVPDKFPKVVGLASNVSLKVLVDNAKTVSLLDKVCDESRIELDVLLKIDCNYRRCGVDPKSTNALDIAEQIDISPRLRYAGVLTHAGHAYYATSVDEIRNAADDEQSAVLDFVDFLRKSRGLDSETISIGSTPSLLLTKDIRKGITEVRPGSYVFFDYTQVVLGVCKLKQCSQTVIASVIGTYEDRIIIDAGATALSKDVGPAHIEPDCGFGMIFDDYDDKTLAEDTRIVALSQEHGKIKIGPDSPLKKLQPGDKVRILSNHSCLVSNMFDRFNVAEGDRITEQWNIERFRNSA